MDPLTGADTDRVDFLIEDPASLAPMRQWITEWRNAGLFTADDDDLVAILLVCTELAINAIEHAQPPRVLRIAPAWGDCCLLIELDDAGPPVQSLSVDPVTTAHHGRGLAIVAAMVTDWGVDHRRLGKTVWAYVDTRE